MPVDCAAAKANSGYMFTIVYERQEKQDDDEEEEEEEEEVWLAQVGPWPGLPSRLLVSLPRIVEPEWLVWALYFAELFS